MSFLVQSGKVKFSSLFACSKVKLVFVELLFIVRESSCNYVLCFREYMS